MLPPGWCLVEMRDSIQRTCTTCLGTMGKRDDKGHHPALSTLTLTGRKHKVGGKNNSEGRVDWWVLGNRNEGSS